MTSVSAGHRQTETGRKRERNRDKQTIRETDRERHTHGQTDISVSGLEIS